MSTKKGTPRATKSYKQARMRVLFRDNFTCAYCHKEANQVDHVVPIARDASMASAIDTDNLVACCADCNRRKGAKPLSVFLAQTATPPERVSLIFPQTMTETVHNGPMTGGLKK